MGELINLHRARKRAKKEEAAKEAQTNRARFGRTKAQRARDKADAARSVDQVEAHKLPPKDAT